MSVPITGLLLIPLGTLVLFLPWRFCLAALMAFAMMSPAAVVNAGHFGLQPGYYLAILLIGRIGAKIVMERFRLNGFVLLQMRPLFWFQIVVFAVLFLAACFFQGQVETLPGTEGFKSGLVHPFHLSRENFTQIAYLVLNTALVYAMAHKGAYVQTGRLLSMWDIAVACGLCFAVAICIWQFASLYAGVPFPSDFFYSNAGYSRADSQSMVGLFRINGPFEEPSTLGYTFTGYILYAWGRFRVHPTAFTIGMIAASIFCMAVSTSTTAFLGLFLFGSVALFDVATGRTKLFSRSATLSPGALAAIVVVCAAVLVGAVVAAENWQAISIILKTTVFDKSRSTSFQQRSFADFLALEIFAKTYGIGVGLGSHKANSLLLTLLSNTGVIGFVLFASFALFLLRWKPHSGEKGRDNALAVQVRPFQLSLIGLLLIHLFSNPNLSALSLWLAMGGLLAIQASAKSFYETRPSPPVERSYAGNAVTYSPLAAP